MELSRSDKAKRAYAKENTMLVKNVDDRHIEGDIEGWAKNYDEVVDMLKARQDKQADAPNSGTLTLQACLWCWEQKQFPSNICRRHGVEP